MISRRKPRVSKNMERWYEHEMLIRQTRKSNFNLKEVK